MSNEELQAILSNVLLALQLCLGLWQFLKLTPVGALVKGVVGYWLLRPLGLSPTYTRLLSCKGRVFKEVACYTTTAEDQKTETYDDFPDRLKWLYLGVEYVIERRAGNKLFINGQMSYFITDRIWRNLSIIPGQEKVVFVKQYKDFWKGVATGGVMNLSQLLDCLILDNHRMKFLKEHYLLLPVDLSASEEKLLKILNMAGLFFLAKKVYWPIPTFFSFTSAVLEFSTPLRTWLYGKFNLVFCCVMHRIIDRFSYSLRRQMYSLGIWVENLKPSNDIKSSVVRGNIICVVIAGGAKTHKEGAVLVPPGYFSGQQRQYFRKSQSEHHQREERDDLFVECIFNCSNLVIVATFRRRFGYCEVHWTDKFEKSEVHWTDEFEKSDEAEYLYFDMSRDEFLKLRTFISVLTKNESGSLKSSRHNNSLSSIFISNRLQVRGLKESILCYVKNEFPPVYELEFHNAVVN